MDIKSQLEEILKTAKKPSGSSFKQRAFTRGLDVACGCESHINSHSHTYFSLQDAVSTPEAMVNETAMKGFRGIGITDHGTMGGVLRAGEAASKWKTGRLKDNTHILYKEVNLKDHSKNYTACDFDWNPITGLEGKAFVQHNTEDTKLFRVLDKTQFTHIGDFKAVSGCELYVSWEKYKDRKYHHITVYATGQKGHRALVLLTSIGSIPSRRFIGNRGFHRPRVFMEDIEVAVKESDGELIVTTGCPISITSSALREGNEAEAREFFEWGKRVLADGNFFAELHICDVSLDFNRFYKDAEDKFWAAIAGVPVSRFRLNSQSEAQKYADRLSKILRSTFSRNHKNLSVVSLSETLSVDEVERLLESYRRNCIHAYTEEEEYLEKADAAKLELEQKKFTLKGEAALLGENEELYLRKKSKDLRKIEKKIKRGANLLDEDSLALINFALKFFGDDLIKVSSLSSERTGSKIAKLVLIIAGEILQNKEDTEVVSVLQVVQSMLSSPSINDNGEVSLALLEISKNESLYLDRVLSNEVDATELVAKAELGLGSIFTPKSGDEAWLNPIAGSEDELEKEWIEHAEGNWMVKVNKALVALAKEYNVPLLLATDAHMTSPDLKVTQDAIIKRGNRRNWVMSRPYAIPRADLVGFILDTGHHHRHEGMAVRENCGFKMLEEKCFTLDDMIEALGAGSLMLDRSECVSSFSWHITVPRIRYRDHKFFKEAATFLDSGELREFLPKEGKYAFTEKSINISSSLICIHYFDFVSRGKFEDDEVYRDRFIRELHMSQEVGDLQLADFFLVLAHAIHIFRDRGVSVGPGRGSAAGMILSYICEITTVDPVSAGLKDSRWITAGRKLDGSQPDIDVDVSNREISSRVLAQVSLAAAIDEIAKRPLSPLEVILHNELFYSPEDVTHEEIGGMVVERRVYKKDLKSSFIKNIKSAGKQEKEESEEEIEFDAVVDEDEDPTSIVFGAPIIRVGTYQSLKAKAAVKEAVRIADVTPFDLLPSFADPTPQWKIENRSRLRGLSDEAIARLYESEQFSNLTDIEKLIRRRVRLADSLTKAMKDGAGTARLYQNEYDYFMGSVYGVVPDYWEMGKKTPSGSEYAKRYFEANESVKDLIISMLNIYKAPGVHAGGLCFGREALERIPLRCDTKGYVAQYEMSAIEKVGVLKFDILGLATLEQIAQAIKLMFTKLSRENLDWIPTDVYEAVKDGKSTDLIWPHIPLSTEKAALVMIKNRAMTFQIDTPNIGPDLDSLDVKLITGLVRGSNDVGQNSPLVKILDAFLALWRPGPMGVHAHTDYLKRLNGMPYQPLHPWLSPYVKHTFGVIAYQEQVMEIWAAGVKDATEDEVDYVRRAMGKKKLSELAKIDAEGRFIRGCIEQEVPEEIAKAIWNMLLFFAEYGFNMAHSRCYSIITAVTLFLKSHYPEFFFCSTMGLAKSEEAGRFLSEIRDSTRSPCVLASEEVLWSYVDKCYFPGFNTVEGLAQKDQQRIMEIREGLSKEEVLQLKPTEFFLRLFKTGNITLNFATSLSSSGLLRRLGTSEDIANGYANAVLSLKREKKETTRSAKLKLVDDNFGNELGSKKKVAPRLELTEDEQFAHNYLSERQFFKAVKTGEISFSSTGWFHNFKTDEELLSFQATGDAPFYAMEVDSIKSLEESLETAKETALALEERIGKIGLKSELSRLKADLPKADKLVYLALKYNESSADPNNLSVSAARNLCLKTKIKGLGVKYLTLAMYKEHGADSQIKGDWITLNDLKKLETKGQKIELGKSGRSFRTTAFLKAFSMVDAKDRNTGETWQEPRLTLIADGDTLNAKFSIPSFGKHQIEQAKNELNNGLELSPVALRLKELSEGGLSNSDAIDTVRGEMITASVEMIKDEKFTKPFEFTIFASTFLTKDGRNTRVTYFKIEDIKRID